MCIFKGLCDPKPSFIRGIARETCDFSNTVSLDVLLASNFLMGGRMHTIKWRVVSQMSMLLVVQVDLS